MKNQERQQALEDAMKQLSDNSGLLKNNENVQKFIKERMEIEDTLKKKTPLVKEYLALFKDAEKRPYTNIGRMAKEMKNIAAKQEILKIAVELCTNEDAKKELIEQRNKLQQSPAIVSYEKYMQGLKYLAGMTNEVQPEVERFFKEDMRIPLLKEDYEYEQYRTGVEEPAITEEDKLEKVYQKAIAPAKAREFFSRQSIMTKAIEIQFLGTDYIDNPNTFSAYPFTDRNTPAAFCVGKLLQMGYSLDEVLDPRALQDVKKEVGAFYKEIRDNNNVALYTEEMYKNSEASIKAFKEYVKKHKDELKTEHDLVQHMSKLGTLGFLCYDNLQELPKGANKVQQLGLSFTFKTQKEISDMVEEMGKYICATGNGYGVKIEYTLDRVGALSVAAVTDRMLYSNKFLEEIQKDEPDYDSFLMTGADRGPVINQINTLSEFQEIFGKEDSVNMETIDEESIIKIASMHEMKFIKDNKITYDRSRAPMTVTKTPEFTVGLKDDLKKGDVINCAVSRNGKQITPTNLPVRIENRFRSWETKNFRGKEKDNSAEFNNLLRTYDETNRKVVDSKLSNKEYLGELAKLKEAAMQYINAKRAQKGYGPATKVPDKIDKQMRGVEKGKSIFTKKGRERYEFALKAIMQIDKMEAAIQEYEKKNPTVEKEKVETEIQNKQNDTVLKNEEINSKNRDVIEEVMKEDELDGFSK